jgi:hypothetical protein
MYAKKPVWWMCWSKKPSLAAAEHALSLLKNLWNDQQTFTLSDRQPSPSLVAFELQMGVEGIVETYRRTNITAYFHYDVLHKASIEFY